MYDPATGQWAVQIGGAPVQSLDERDDGHHYTFLVLRAEEQKGQATKCSLAQEFRRRPGVIFHKITLLSVPISSTHNKAAREAYRLLVGLGEAFWCFVFGAWGGKRKAIPALIAVTHKIWKKIYPDFNPDHALHKGLASHSPLMEPTRTRRKNDLAYCWRQRSRQREQEFSEGVISSETYAYAKSTFWYLPSEGSLLTSSDLDALTTMASEETERRRLAVRTHKVKKKWENEDEDNVLAEQVRARGYRLRSVVKKSQKELGEADNRRRRKRNWFKANEHRKGTKEWSDERADMEKKDWRQRTKLDETAQERAAKNANALKQRRKLWLTKFGNDPDVSAKYLRAQKRGFTMDIRDDGLDPDTEAQLAADRQEARRQKVNARTALNARKRYWISQNPAANDAEKARAKHAEYRILEIDALIARETSKAAPKDWEDEENKRDSSEKTIETKTTRKIRARKARTVEQATKVPAAIYKIRSKTEVGLEPQPEEVEQAKVHTIEALLAPKTPKAAPEDWENKEDKRDTSQVPTESKAARVTQTTQVALSRKPTKAPKPAKTRYKACGLATCVHRERESLDAILNNLLRQGRRISTTPPAGLWRSFEAARASGRESLAIVDLRKIIRQLVDQVIDKHDKNEPESSLRLKSILTDLEKRLKGKNEKLIDVGLEKLRSLGEELRDT